MEDELFEFNLLEKKYGVYLFFIAQIHMESTKHFGLIWKCFAFFAMSKADFDINFYRHLDS